MSEGISAVERGVGAGCPPALSRALARWTARADDRALAGWLDRELDPQGLPRRLPVSAWGECLDAMAMAQGDRPEGWSMESDARIEGLLRGVIRFGRPDGSVIFGPIGPDPGRLASLRAWADRLSDPSLAAVAARWAPPSARGRAGLALGPPPLPAHASSDRPLAILRADWSARGDWLAIDHRDRAGRSLLELTGLGRPFLGPDWFAGLDDPGDEAVGLARPLSWKTGPEADCAEWTFRTRTARVVRMAMLLRGRGLALLADQVEGPAPVAGLRVAISSAVGAEPVAGSRALVLRAERGRSARVLPIGLPASPSPTDRGAIEVSGGAIVLRQRAEGGRCWLPLLVSWRPDRDRRPTRWRTLTVSERSRVCPPGVAFAARVAWGHGEGLVLYRSLARPALRVFLGHQTRARFLVGLFTREGDVRPLIRIDD